MNHARLPIHETAVHIYHFMNYTVDVLSYFSNNHIARPGRDWETEGFSVILVDRRTCTFSTYEYVSRD
jgi:hypothetical protein